MVSKIIFILILFTLFLCSMIGMKQWTLSTGTPVLLETQPIDPRSLFRGDYVRLNYSISNLKPSELTGDDEFKKHDVIYVTLKKQKKYCVPQSVTHEAPQENDLYLKGTIQYVSQHSWNQETETSDEITNLQIKYGIENYFVPEYEGLELERRDNDQVVDIRVAIDKYGRSGIKAVLVNDIIKYKETLL